MNTKKSIIFIGHEASISGAPILFLNLLNLLKEEGSLEITVVIKRYGSFVKEYEKFFTVMVLKGENYSDENRLLQRTGNIIGNRIKLTRLFLKAIFADVIFSNTITNGILLKTLSFFRKKIITYVHELEHVIRWYMPASRYSLQYSRRFAYPSDHVAEVLSANYKIDHARLFRLSYYFPFNETIVNDEKGINVFRQAFKAKYGIRNEFIVGNIGVLCKRKGSDLFFEVCARVVRVNPDIKFCWIGKFEDTFIENEIKALIAEKGIANNVILTGVLPHHYFNYSSFNVFFLSSREDPYPLVVIEAGLMKIPAICFSNSGGITEFIKEDIGWVINECSIELTASKILELYANQNEIKVKGDAAYRKALEQHVDKNRIKNQFNELITGI